MDVNNLEKRYMIWDLVCKKYCGFQLRAGGDPKSYVNYGSAVSYIKKYSSSDNRYVIDMYCLLHRDLKDKKLYD